jgi:CRISPR-associated protein Cas1
MVRHQFDSIGSFAVVSQTWRILDLTELHGSLGNKSGQFVVEGDGQPLTRVPVADVAIVLVGVGVKMSSGALLKFAAADTVLLVCDWRGIPRLTAAPWSTHTRAGARQIAQATAPRERSGLAWSALVRAKLSGEAQTLQGQKPRKAKMMWSFAEAV